MTVKELMKILAGTPGDMEVLITDDGQPREIEQALRVETSEDGDYLLLLSSEPAI